MSFQFSRQIQPFLEHCHAQQNLSANTLLGYRQDLRAFARFLSNNQKSAIGSHCIIAYLSHLRVEKGLAPATVRRRIVCLRKFFAWALKSCHGSPDPFDGLEIDLSVPHRLPRPIDRTTLSRLFLYAQRSRFPTHDHTVAEFGVSSSIEFTTALATRLLVATGLRVGELTHLRLSDLSAEASRIRVFGKGDRERTVYVTNTRLLSDLREYVSLRLSTDEPESYLFINRRGSRLTEAAFRKRLRNISSSLALGEILTPHRFRHSAATMLIEEGVDIRIVQRLLGHASIATTEIYTKVSDNSLINAIAKADTLSRVDV